MDAPTTPSPAGLQYRCRRAPPVPAWKGRLRQAATRGYCSTSAAERASSTFRASPSCALKANAPTRLDRVGSGRRGRTDQAWDSALCAERLAAAQSPIAERAGPLVPNPFLLWPWRAASTPKDNVVGSVTCDAYVMESPVRPVGFRRVKPPTSRRWNPLRLASRYEVVFGDDSRTILTLDALDALLEGRRYPADFWACVAAADDAHLRGEASTLIEWPSGQRRPPQGDVCADRPAARRYGTCSGPDRNGRQCRSQLSIDRRCRRTARRDAWSGGQGDLEAVDDGCVCQQRVSLFRAVQRL
jgi:hypothetical protein